MQRRIPLRQRTIIDRSSVSTDILVSTGTIESATTAIIAELLTDLGLRDGCHSPAGGNGRLPDGAMTDRAAEVPLDLQHAIENAEDGDDLWLDSPPPTDWHDCPEYGPAFPVCRCSRQEETTYSP